MKGKNVSRLCVSLLLLLGTCSLQAQSLKDILSGIKNEVEKVTDKTSSENIVGTWRYESPVCEFKSDQLLSQAGGKVVATKVEKQLAEACTKLRLSAENTYYQFNEDGTYVQCIAGKQMKGTYTYNEEARTIALKGRLGREQTFYIAIKSKEMTLVFDADWLLTAAKGVANIAGKYIDSSMFTIFSSVSDNYDGMRLGFRLKP